MPILRKNEEKPLTIISSHVIYRSNWLEYTPDVRELLLNKDWFQLNENLNWNCWGLSLIGIENNNIINETFNNSELREVEAFFHLFMRDLPHPFELTEEQRKFNNPKKPFEYTGDPNWELDESLRQDVQPIEKAVLASLFLDRDEIPIKFRYIHDLMHGTPIERFNRSYTLPDHWEIPLPDHTREVSSLGLEEGMATVEDLRTLRTRSYYHVDKSELIGKVRYLLSKGFFDNVTPNTMDEVRELYDRLLNYRGAIMWETASNQFPEDEVIYLWNRSMTSQSIERAWHLNPVSERVDNSIPNFKVTHHRMVRDGDRLIPTIDTEVWTNDQLRDALGYDWMYDQNLTLEDNWMDTGRNVDHHIVSRIAAFADQVAAILPVESDYQGGFLIRTDSDHVFLEPRENLLERMGDPNYVDGVEPTLPLREDLDSQPINPSVERCLYNGSTLRDFSLVRDNLLRSLDMREFSDWEYKPRENSSLFYNTSGLQGAYMLNLFFHQNRLDGLYSWYQDIYLSNVRYLREYLRSVNLNSDYQVNDDGLTLSDEWQLYLRNSNIFVDAYVRNFGRLPFPFIKLIYNPYITLNDLNNLKLLRLSMMKDMNYLCFLIQSYFLRFMVDGNYDFELNLLNYLSERSMLFDYTLPITIGIQVNDVTFDGSNLSNLDPRFLQIIQKHNSLSSIQIKERKKFCQSILKRERETQLNFELNYSILNDNKFSFFFKNLWLDYLTLTRFLQDDSIHKDKLSWVYWINDQLDKKVTTSWNKLDRLMFQDTDCQVHPQPELDRIPESDRQNLLDQWYLSSENRKVSPNLHNRELRSLLPVFLMSQVLGGDELNMDFLPTNEQLNDPVRFVSSLELANSFFDDYNSRKTWSDEDIDMLERVLTEYDQLNSLSEELSEEFFHYVVQQGNSRGIVDLLLLFNVMKQDKNEKDEENMYLQLNNYGVSILSLRKKFFSFLRLDGKKDVFLLNLLDYFSDRCNSSNKKNVKILTNLRKVEQHIINESIQVRLLTEINAPFLKRSYRQEINDTLYFKLLYLDDSVIRNIFVRNNMLNKLARVRAKDKLILALPSLNREAVEQTIKDYISNLSVSWVRELVQDRAWVEEGLFLESDYLGYLLSEGVNLRRLESPTCFLEQVMRINAELSSSIVPNMLNEEIVSMMNPNIQQVMFWEVSNLRQGNKSNSFFSKWVKVNSQSNLDKIVAIISKREHLLKLLENETSLFEIRLPTLDELNASKNDQVEDKFEQQDELSILSI